MQLTDIPQEWDSSSTAVLVIDLQKDFIEHYQGSLAVAGTDSKYCQSVIDWTLLLAKKYPIYACMDWHPADHVSFVSMHPHKKPGDLVPINSARNSDGRPYMQILWPDHCVQGTRGSENILDEKLFQTLVRKGNHREFDSYSGFFDDGGKDTGLDSILKRDGIQNLIVYGLAFDYCVLASVRDAQQLGYQIVVLEQYCRGVAADSSEQARQHLNQLSNVSLISEPAQLP